MQASTTLSFKKFIENSRRFKNILEDVYIITHVSTYIIAYVIPNVNIYAMPHVDVHIMPCSILLSSKIIFDEYLTSTSFCLTRIDHSSERKYWAEVKW